MKFKLSVAAAIAIIAAAAFVAPDLSRADGGEAVVRSVLMAAFDKPEARLVVDPVVVERDVAIASWTQGDTGGRAILRLKNGSWSIVLCGGDGLKEAATFKPFGFSASEAASLAHRIVEAEAVVPEGRRAMFSKFVQTVRMEH